MSYLHTLVLIPTTALFLFGGKNAGAQSVILYSPPAVYPTFAAPSYSVPITTYRPIVATPAPVVSYSPAYSALAPVAYPVAPLPAVTAYRPLTTSVAPVVSYSPAVSYAPTYTPAVPTVSYSPVVAYSPAVAAVPAAIQAVGITPVFPRTTYYVPGQPIRNVLRALTP
jgi:hypothetical protein